MKLLFFKCNHDHYFRNVSCPYDGWTHSDVPKVEMAFRAGAISKLEDLHALEIDPRLVRQIILIESFEYDSALEGIAFESVVIDGCVRKLGVGD